MDGNMNARCEIIQKKGNCDAEFVNEQGSQTLGVVRGDRVWIPEWSCGQTQGLQGVLQGDRIVWPDGNFWSR